MRNPYYDNPMNENPRMTDEKAPPEGPPSRPPAGATPPATAEGTPPETALESPVPPTAESQATSTDWESRFKYLLADFENYRKRAERDRESVRFRAEADVLRNLLPIQDSFERARDFVRKAPHSDPVRKGMELLAHEWDAFLKREGIQPVAHVGSRFDPDEHEVMGEAPPPPGSPPGHGARGGPAGLPVPRGSAAPGEGAGRSHPARTRLRACGRVEPS